jgi:hypothetical protein
MDMEATEATMLVALEVLPVLPVLAVLLHGCSRAKVGMVLLRLLHLLVCKLYPLVNGFRLTS